MRRSILAMLGAGVLTTGLAASSTPAHAVWVRSSTAPLVDASRVDSGCDLDLGPARAVEGPTEGPYAGSPGYVEAQGTLACSHHWRAQSINARWQAVRADGSRSAVFWGGEARSWAPDDWVPPTEPVVYGSGVHLSPCMLKADGQMHLPGSTTQKWLLPLGRNDFIIGNTAKVNEYKSDGHPYRAVVERLITVRCTTSRAAYR
jgi:hypothetical protein